jgi:hypothetical protein
VSVTRVGEPLPAAARLVPQGGELTQPRWGDLHETPSDQGFVEPARDANGGTPEARPTGIRWPNAIGMGIGAFLGVIVLGLLFLGPHASTPTDQHAISETPSLPTAAQAPTETPAPPTATLTPTKTPVPPTATSLPTETPAPPTDTPEPTATPAPPTDTPEPTATPVISAVEPFGGVVNTAVKVRKGPGLEYDPVLQIYPGTAVTVTSVATNSVGEVWFLVDWDRRPPGFRDTWLLSALVEKRP